MFSILSRIAYAELLGFPVVFWLGILTYSFVAATFAVMHFGRRRPWKFKGHRYLGWSTLALATLHGLLAISAYLG